MAMKKDLDIRAFNEMFDTKVKKLRGAERITKVILGELSREVLEQMHFNGDIQPVNRLLDALTPVNRKVTVLYFQHFSGHLYSEKEGKFGKRDKNLYNDKYKASEEFLDDEDNNIWTWSKKHVAIKDFSLENVEKYIKNTFVKAKEKGVSDVDIVKAIFAGGMEVDTVLAVMKEMADKIDNPEKQAA